MDYERIDKVQTGIISPSKLRLKLIGPHHQKRKDGTNYDSSSRTSPSKLDDAEFVKNSLLASKNGNFDDEGSSKDFEGVSSPHIVAPPIEVSSVKVSGEGASNSGQGDQTCFQPTDILPKEIGEMGLVKIQQLSRDYPMKSLEDNPDYDSNACSSRFEFYKGERSLHNHMVRPFSRSMSSKWNDAEKWIVNRQPVHLNHSKKTTVQNLVNRQPMTSLVRVVPESTSSDQKTSVIPVMDTRQINSHHLTAQIGLDKFTFSTPETHPISDSADAENVSVDLCLLSREEKEVNYKELSGSEKLTANIAGFPVIRSVAMRDMGTEMTPVTSQEPSRTATPVGATTPLRSPTSSIPSTPGRGAPAPTPVETSTNDESKLQEEGSKKELSEQELKLKTRREIISLGVQLGKMNIAAWASKDEREKNASFIESTDEQKLARIEFKNRAAAWEEVEKSKHTARYKHEEIKIQAWESRQKAKMKADMRRIEAKAKQMRVHSQEKMKKKIAIARQRSEEKRAAAEAKRNRQAARTAAQAEYIRQTGSIPSSYFICCSCYHKF